MPLLNNIELMRKFYPDLPEKLARNGLTKEQILAWDPDTYQKFVESSICSSAINDPETEEWNRPIWHFAITLNEQNVLLHIN